MKGALLVIPRRYQTAAGLGFAVLVGLALLIGAAGFSSANAGRSSVADVPYVEGQLIAKLAPRASLDDLDSRGEECIGEGVTE